MLLFILCHYIILWLHVFLRQFYIKFSTNNTRVQILLYLITVKKSSCVSYMYLTLSHLALRLFLPFYENLYNYFFLFSYL